MGFAQKQLLPASHVTCFLDIVKQFLTIMVRRKTSVDFIILKSKCFLFLFPLPSFCVMKLSWTERAFESKVSGTNQNAWQK